MLMDVSQGPFDLQKQRRLWSLLDEAEALRRVRGVRNVVLGVNNVLVSFDPLDSQPEAVAEALQQSWSHSAPREAPGRLVEVPVAYDLSAGSELEGIAQHVELDMGAVVELHTSAEYYVACIGSVPGFAYLVGLPPKLSMPRHTTPRARIPKGTVAVGGSQTGVIPMDMPSGWHAMGTTELNMFDPARSEPCLLAAGDRVRFTAKARRP